MLEKAIDHLHAKNDANALAALKKTHLLELTWQDPKTRMNLGHLAAIFNCPLSLAFLLEKNVVTLGDLNSNGHTVANCALINNSQIVANLLQKRQFMLLANNLHGETDSRNTRGSTDIENDAELPPLAIATTRDMQETTPALTNNDLLDLDLKEGQIDMIISSTLKLISIYGSPTVFKKIFAIYSHKYIIINSQSDTTTPKPPILINSYYFLAWLEAALMQGNVAIAEHLLTTYRIESTPENKNIHLDLCEIILHHATNDKYLHIIDSVLTMLINFYGCTLAELITTKIKFCEMFDAKLIEKTVENSAPRMTEKLYEIYAENNILLLETLFLFIEHNQLTLLEKLVALNIANGRLSDNEAGIFFAVKRNNAPALMLFNKKNVRLDVRNSAGLTLLDVAKKHSAHNAIEFLKHTAQCIEIITLEQILQTTLNNVPSVKEIKSTLDIFELLTKQGEKVMAGAKNKFHDANSYFLEHIFATMIQLKKILGCLYMLVEPDKAYAQFQTSEAYWKAFIARSELVKSALSKIDAISKSVSVLGNDNPAMINIILTRAVSVSSRLFSIVRNLIAGKSLTQHPNLLPFIKFLEYYIFNCPIPHHKEFFNELINIYNHHNLTSDAEHVITLANAEKFTNDLKDATDLNTYIDELIFYTHTLNLNKPPKDMSVKAARLAESLKYIDKYHKVVNNHNELQKKIISCLHEETSCAKITLFKNSLAKVHTLHAGVLNSLEALTSALTNSKSLVLLSTDQLQALAVTYNLQAAIYKELSFYYKAVNEKTPSHYTQTQTLAFEEQYKSASQEQLNISDAFIHKLEDDLLSGEKKKVNKKKPPAVGPVATKIPSPPPPVSTPPVAQLSVNLPTKDALQSEVNTATKTLPPLPPISAPPPAAQLPINSHIKDTKSPSIPSIKASDADNQQQKNVSPKAGALIKPEPPKLPQNTFWATINVNNENVTSPAPASTAANFRTKAPRPIRPQNVDSYLVTQVELPACIKNLPTICQFTYKNSNAIQAAFQLFDTQPNKALEEYRKIVENYYWDDMTDALIIKIFIALNYTQIAESIIHKQPMATMELARLAIKHLNERYDDYVKSSDPNKDLLSYIKNQPHNIHIHFANLHKKTARNATESNKQTEHLQQARQHLDAAIKDLASKDPTNAKIADLRKQSEKLRLLAEHTNTLAPQSLLN